MIQQTLLTINSIKAPDLARRVAPRWTTRLRWEVSLCQTKHLGGSQIFFSDLLFTEHLAAALASLLCKAKCLGRVIPIEGVEMVILLHLRCLLWMKYPPHLGFPTVVVYHLTRR